MKTENLEIRELGENDLKAWDDFVERSPQGSIFSSSSWFKVLNEAHDGTSEILVVFKNGRIVGGILIFVRKKSIFKVVGLPPLTPFTSVLFDESNLKKLPKIESQQKIIIKAISDYLIKKYGFISISLQPNVGDIRQFLWCGWNAIVNYTYESEIRNLKELWNNLGKDARTTINKGKHNGLTISNGDISDFYGLYVKTFSRQNLGTPIKEDFIKKLYCILSKNNKCKLYFSKTKEGKNAASALVVWDNKKAYYLLAASDPEIKEGAPSFLLWKIIEDISKSFEKLDLVGANTPHIVKFKNEFATKLVPYYGVEKYNSLILRYLVKVYKIIR